MFAIVDCNNFYASCEKLFDPSLRVRPLVVLSNNDGCVIARSAEAKALGVVMGVPVFQIKEMIARHNIVVRSTNFELYGDISNRVMCALDRFSSTVEKYSIDEAFLEIPSHVKELREYGTGIRKDIRRSLGIETGIGIAPTKTLAKAANWYAKKHGDGLTVIGSPEETTPLLKMLPITEVWGVGRRLSKKLQLYGIKTAYDFVTKMPEHKVQEWMTIVGVRTWKELQGIRCLELEEKAPEKQSIATTRSFGKMVSDIAQLEEAVASFTEACAAKARKEHLVARKIQVFIHTNFYRKDLPTYARNCVLKLPVPSADPRELIAFAKEALASIFSPDYEYKKAGVVLMDLVPDSEVQTSFLDTVDRTKSDALNRALDTLNSRFGRKTLHVAASGMRSKKSRWHMNQNALSPCYTTRWSDIMVVKV